MRPERGKHFLGLEAGLIKTESFVLTQRYVQDCIAFQALGLFFGVAGHGKTFALAEALVGCTRRVLWITFGSKATGRSVAHALLTEATGARPAVRGREEDFRDELIDYLDGEPVVIVIDEAQALHQDCFYLLRLLHDHPLANVTLLLVGTPALRHKARGDGTLWRRRHRCLTFKPLPLPLLQKTLPRYHPIYAAADPELLEEINDTCGHGNIGHWAAFTLTAAQLCKETEQPTITSEIVEAAYRMVNDDD